MRPLRFKQPPINIRHLQTFYHVVQNGGINRSVGKMPYGIQQPAISEQMLLLEEDIDSQLFHRQRFQLTPAGRSLYEQIWPFFKQLEDLNLGRYRSLDTLRIAAEDTLIRRFLPSVARSLLSAEPNLQLSCHSGAAADMTQWLQDGKVDLVLSALSGPTPSRFASKPLLTLPLVLLVDEKSTVMSATDLWSAKEITHRLVCPPATESIGEVFRRGLKLGGMAWPTRLIVNSIGSVAAFVAGTDLIGVSVGELEGTRPLVRELPLAGFDAIQITALWLPPNTARLKNVVASLEASSSGLRQVAAAKRR